MEDKKNQKIEIRSEEVQDILGQVPSWIVRWGTVVILATVLILLAGSMIIKYPDKKRAEIRVTTENPPADLIARSNGQIEDLFVKDSQSVTINTHLAVIENSADYSSVISLQYDIEEIRTIIANMDREQYIPLNNTYSLGDIQSAYAEFINKYNDYFQFLDLDFHARTIESIQEEKRKFEIFNNQLNAQVKILNKDYELAQRQYNRDLKLYNDSVIPDAEIDKSEAHKLAAQLKWEESRSKMSANGIEIQKLDQTILDLKLKAQNEKEQKQTDVREAFEKMIAQIDMWEQNYLLKAPIDGIVSFIGFWSETQNVLAGDKVMTIIPADKGEIIGRIDLPMEGSGKVEIGQTVNIQFINFPHLEYGMVKGIIRTISQVPNDKLYKVEVGLPNGLTTYYNREIPFKQEMMGRAEIITDNRVLIERIFSPIRSVITEQQETRNAGDGNNHSE
jgi:multidrug efflux pump subunit AcrA (membrane-fusion protein)